MPRVSVVVTTRNEAANLRHLMDSLAAQEGLEEVVVVDAKSTDGTADVARAYADRIPGLQVIERPCSRGGGRNIGARAATGDLIAFTDGDCIANPFWVRHLARAWDGRADRIVAGRTILMGFWAFTGLHRVELPHRGQDTTWPSCNLAYPRRLFDRLGGFDERFVTAEDIDLNYRAIEAGATIVHAPEAIIYARARDSVSGFASQAYWNGYGRKQLTLKHGRLWHQYGFKDMLTTQGASLFGLARMGCGATGYLRAKMRKGRHP